MNSSNYNIMKKMKKKYGYSDNKFCELCRKALLQGKITENEFVKLTKGLNVEGDEC